MELYAVPGESLRAIADAIRSRSGSDEMLTVSAMADAIAGIPGGGDGIPAPHRIVTITGACEIDVSDLGDYGIGCRISDRVSGNTPCLLSWNPTAGANTIAVYRQNNSLTTNTYASYWQYDASNHVFRYSGSSTAGYNMRGTWLLIGLSV